jgi:tetratricopeptide (TPR) repeat protein
MKQNPRWLAGIVGVALLALSASVYYWSPGVADSPSENTAVMAQRMWAKVTDTTRQEHELKALETSLGEYPDHGPILLRMAQVARDLGRQDESIRHLREAVRVDPRNRDARLELGRVLFESRDVEGAIRETERLLEIDPLDIDGLYNLGAIYGNLGQDERARDYWMKAAAVDPDSEGSRRAEAALKQIGGK